MDKITRILALYSKLIKGEAISKISFCMETDSNGRSFDRDIEDIRLFLSESFSTEELIYDRAMKNYHLSGVAKKSLEMTEYRFIERVVEQSGLLRVDELKGLLSILATNTNKAKECLEKIKKIDKHYISKTDMPLLKMHEDISTMIDLKTVIEINYYDSDEKIKKYQIMPIDILLWNGEISVIALQKKTDEIKSELFDLKKIESFKKLRQLTPCEWNEVEFIAIEETKKIKANMQKYLPD